jgi:hypothetical protein
MLKEKLQRDDNTRDEINKQKKLQHKIDVIQDEMYKLESSKKITFVLPWLVLNTIFFFCLF